jgi:endonuclease/exonuclease/phosphatase family metal-dependent hydrolase
MQKLGMIGLFFLLVGCGQSPEPKQITATTWNVGLAHGYVALAQARLGPVVDALAAIDSDVLCLQEVWSADDQMTVRAALENAGYEVHIYVTDGGGKTGGCTEEEAEPLKQCVFENACDQIPQDQLVDCVTGKCGETLAGVSGDCTGCLVQNLSLPVVEIMEKCIGVTGTGVFSYDGHNGLVLASKTPMTDIVEKDFDASLTYRSYIQAFIPAHEVTVVCTHLTASLSAPYAGSYSGYEEEQAQQVDQLVTELDTGQRIILMGDLNTGIDSTANDIVGELPNNFMKLSDANWTSHTMGACTWCPANNTLIGSGPDRTIDHILTNDVWSAALTSSKARILDGTVMVTGPDDETVETSLSDHYGMTVTLTWPDEAPAE